MASDAANEVRVAIQSWTSCIQSGAVDAKRIDPICPFCHETPTRVNTRTAPATKKRPRRKGGRLIVEGRVHRPPAATGAVGMCRLWRILHPGRRLIPPLSGGSAGYFTVPGERIPWESADAERVGAAMAADRG